MENAGAMPTIQRMLFPESELPPERQVILPAERRQFLKRKWQGTAVDGTMFDFDLAERLSDGCVILRSGGRDYVIRQSAETVYRIPFESPAHAARVAWRAGNLHLPTEILEDAILTLHDDMMGEVLRREGWKFDEPQVVFKPMKAEAHE
jgi:urease accessory protein